MNEVKKVVVVDDDQKVILLVEKVLTENGLNVFTANDGNQALTIMQNEKADLLISDILIPGLDGISLCNSIKNDPGLTNAKVIMMTGVFKQASFKAEMNCKPDGFIEKPLDISTLKSVVMKNLGF